MTAFDPKRTMSNGDFAPLTLAASAGRPSPKFAGPLRRCRWCDPARGRLDKCRGVWISPARPAKTAPFGCTAAISKRVDSSLSGVPKLAHATDVSYGYATSHRVLQQRT